MDTLQNGINPRFQLADLRAFTLAGKSKSSISSSPASPQWTDLELREDIIQALLEGLKHKQPLTSQFSAIPALMKLKTGLFAAPTGCGKTLTYLVPLFQQLKNEEEAKEKEKDDAHGRLDDINNSIGPRALILVPTHELVRQVYRTAKTLSHYAKLKVETIDTVFKYKNPKAADALDILISTPRSFLRNRTEGDFKSNNYLFIHSFIHSFIYLFYVQ